MLFPDDTNRLTMCIVALAAGLLLGQASGCTAPRARGHVREERLWPDGAPGARGARARDTPTLYYYAPEQRGRTRTAVIVAGGGSYGHQGGIRVEAVPTARWLASHGITAIVLRHRVGRWGRHNHDDFLADGAHAVRTVRAHAADLGVDPDRIGFIGFSAGGHMAASLATRCARPVPSGVPSLDGPEPSGISCQPNFAAAIYPVVTLDAPIAHERSVANLVGPAGSRDALREQLSVEGLVTPRTAPMFLVHSSRDRKVDVRNSDLLFDALSKNDVQVEYHRPDDGRHGVGLAQRRRMSEMGRWPDAFLQWVAGLDER